MLKGDHSSQRRQEKILPEKDAAQKTQESWPKRILNWVLAAPPLYIRYFFPILVTLGIIGGAAALWIPSNTGWLRQGGLQGEPEQKAISDLRLHFLYITGGIIAILTLLQTNWKNQVDHRKVEDDIQKNKNDHIRQVHAERRSRYAKAIEQLADNKASIRLGGIYTLVGLVDEWLNDDKTLSDSAEDSNKRKEEGQIIVNSLCAYIRSPIQIPKKSKNTTHEMTEEQGVRQAIFKEMSNRIKIAFEESENLYNYWAYFEYDFSNSKFFYPLSGHIFTSPDFSGSTFQEGSDISKSIFYGSPKFNGSHFEMELNLTAAKFYHKAYFKEAEFFNLIILQDTLFTDDLFFVGSKFHAPLRLGNTQVNGDTFFSHSIFGDSDESWEASFKNAVFKGRAYFSEAHFKVPTLFEGSLFLSKASFFDAVFEKPATFKNSIFYGSTSFNKASLRSEVLFREISFMGKAWFSKARFESLCTYNFISFRGPAIFNKARFLAHSIFKNINFHGSTDICNANFSQSPIFKNTLFSINKYAKYINPGSPISKKINIGAATLLNDNNEILSQKTVPAGTRLFDPHSWNLATNKYDQISSPAQ